MLARRALVNLLFPQRPFSASLQRDVEDTSSSFLCISIKERLILTCRMNFSKNSALVVILIGGLSLIGLALIQYKWLLQGIELNRQGFERQMSEVEREVRRKLANRADLFYNASQTISGEIHSVEQNETLTPVSDIFAQTLDSVLKINRIPLEAVVYLRAGLGECPLMQENPPDNKVLFGADGVKYSVCACGLTESGKLIDYGFKLKGENAFLVKKSMGLLQLVLLFILLLAAVLAYAIRTINQQKKLSAIKNDFINNLTHEFKTPIFTIGLTTKTLKKSSSIKSSDKLTSYVDLIEQENNRLKNQVDKVLQMALIDSGNLLIEKRPADLHRLIHKIADSFQLRLRDSRGQLNLHFASSPINLDLDETHFANLIYNLLDNACKYTTRPPQIDLSTFSNSREIEIRIQDRGAGMDEKTQKMVFDRFFRGQKSDVHDIKGFGLGLSYVKSIVDLHKGRILLKSKAGQGTTFRIFLPK